MRIGIVSDVHCEHEALGEAAEQLLARGVDEILLAGDAHYEYRFSNEVVDVIWKYQMTCVQGNHDAMLLSAAGRRAASAPHVLESHLEFMRKVPTRVTMQAGDKTLLMVHANPWADDNEYLYEGHPLFARCDELDADYLVLGHTHVPMAIRYGRTLVINPGSLMQSRDPGADGMLTYAVLDTDTDDVELVREP